jgi:hypothetical protein
MTDTTDHITELSSQILDLQERHRMLELEIEQMMSFPYTDQLQLQRLKKQKLRLKDTIEKLKTSLIPDLDA